MRATPPTHTHRPGEEMVILILKNWKIQVKIKVVLKEKLKRKSNAQRKEELHSLHSLFVPLFFFCDGTKMWRGVEVISKRFCTLCRCCLWRLLHMCTCVSVCIQFGDPIWWEAFVMVMSTCMKRALRHWEGNIFSWAGWRHNKRDASAQKETHAQKKKRKSAHVDDSRVHDRAWCFCCGHTAEKKAEEQVALRKWGKIKNKC